MAENPTTYFPDVPVMWDIATRYVFATQIGQTLALREQRRTIAPAAGIREITLSTTGLEPEERFEVVEFFKSVRGELIPFYFFHPAHHYFADLPIGDATASVAFDATIPFKEAVIEAVTISGSAQSYVYTSDYGTGGEDRLQIASPTHTGTVRLTFRGRERIAVRNAQPLVETWLANTPEQKAVLQLAFREVY